MSELEKASAEAVAAQANSEQVAMVLAILQAQQITQQQTVTAVTPVQQSSGGAAKWVGIGAGASIFLLTVAVSAVAVAISAVSLTICVLVLRSMWTDIQKGKR